MAVSESQDSGVATRTLEVRLADGETIEAHVDADGESGGDSLLAGLHDRLGVEPYVQLGDTLVRSQDVRLVRLKQDGGSRHGMIRSLLGTGGHDDMTTMERDRTMHTQRSMGERMQQGWLDRPRRGETTPFFATSEFLAMLAAVTAIGICAAVFDNLDVRLGLILITGIVGAYILSRGIAKAGTPYNARSGDRGWGGDGGS